MTRLQVLAFFLATVLSRGLVCCPPLVTVRLVGRCSETAMSAGPQAPAIARSHRGSRAVTAVVSGFPLCSLAGLRREGWPLPPSALSPPHQGPHLSSGCPFMGLSSDTGTVPEQLCALAARGSPGRRCCRRCCSSFPTYRRPVSGLAARPRGRSHLSLLRRVFSPTQSQTSYSGAARLCVTCGDGPRGALWGRRGSVTGAFG